MPARPADVDGQHVLYHYLQKELLRKDIWLFQMLTARLVVSLGIWFAPEVYRRLPIALPYAVRDPSCRGDRGRGLPDEWGAPDAAGRFRDDNSLVKGLPRSLTIVNLGNPLYHGRRMGPGFVAAHVWRTTSDGLASRNPLTYSFLPNLVWLPAQVAKLTDREGSFVQGYLQALSRHIYRSVDLPAPVASVVEPSWETLESVPRGVSIPPEGLPDPAELNYFRADAEFIDRRVKVIEQVAAASRRAAEGSALPERLISSRYREGLPGVSAAALRRHAARLEELAAAARRSGPGLGERT